MSDAQIVTELVVDASGAVTGTAQAGAALDSYGGRAQAAADQTAKLQQAIDNQTVSWVKSPTSISAVQNAYDRLTATLDPHVKMQQKLQAATDTITAAQQRGIITQTQASAAIEAASAKYSTATGLSAALADATGAVTRQMVAMASGAGPAGVFLSALGPWGLAAAVGIGLTESAIEKMINAAGALGDWAHQIEDASLATGVNAEQLQVLDLAAQKVGVSADNMTTKFERFVVGLGQLKDGTGQLYTQLERVNPALVAQLSTTTSNAVAWDLLAKAYASANGQQQALIAQAAFGRGGAQAGLVLLATNAAGGLANATSATNPDAFAQDQVKQWDALKAQIDETTVTAQRDLASIFTTSVLQGELQFATTFKEFASDARNFSMSTALVDLFAKLPAAAAFIPFIGNQLAMLKGLGSAAGSVSSLFSTPAAPPPSWIAPTNLNTSTPTDAGAVAAQASLQQATTAATASIGVQVTQIKEQIAILGDAATADEKLNERLLTLQQAQERDTTGVNANAIARSQAMAVLDAQTERESARIAVLGAAAPVTDQVTQEEQKLQKAIMTGVPLTQAEIDNQKTLAQQRALGVTALISQADAYNVQAQTVGMSIGNAVAFKASQDLINQAMEAGKPLTDAQTDAIKAKAAADGAAAEAAEKAKIANDIAFGKSTALISDQDVQIAQQLRSLYPDVTTAINSSEAAQLRLNGLLKATKSAANDNKQDQKKEADSELVPRLKAA